MNASTVPLAVFTLLILAAMGIPLIRTRPRPVRQGRIDTLDPSIAVHTITDDCGPWDDSAESARRDAQERQWAAEREAPNAE